MDGNSVYRKGLNSISWLQCRSEDQHSDILSNLHSPSETRVPSPLTSCVWKSHNNILSWAKSFIYYSEGCHWMNAGGRGTEEYNPSRDVGEQAAKFMLRLCAKSLFHFPLAHFQLDLLTRNDATSTTFWRVASLQLHSYSKCLKIILNVLQMFFHDSWWCLVIIGHPSLLKTHYVTGVFVQSVLSSEVDPDTVLQ